MTTSSLNIPSRYLEQVCTILRQHFPDYEVWAYGSRVTGGAWEASDLDLVVRNKADMQRVCDSMIELREAFINSNLPISVDVMDWARIPDSFREHITQRYDVVQ